MDNISFKKVWVDPDFYEIEIRAKSECIGAMVRSYTTTSAIQELASHLVSFPKMQDDRYLWENGTKGDDTTPFVSLELRCEDKRGHVVIEVYMEIDDGATYSTHNCCFYIKTEVGLLNSFGKSLLSLNEDNVERLIVLHGDSSLLWC
jgi:hypothetical protein